MIRTAVVGVGALGKHHARIYASLSGVNLAGISDSDQQRGRALAEEYGTTFYPDYRELVDRVDCVSVAVPTSSHHDVCVPFLDAGRHVLVEKPIAVTSDEGSDLIERARRQGAILQVGHLERFNPAFLAVKPLITEPRFFEVHRLGVFVPRSLDIDVIMDLMIHDLDLVQTLVCSPICDIQAVGIPILTDKIDIANVRLSFENGAVANLTASRVSMEKVRKLRLFQPHDYIAIDFARQNAAVYSLCAADTPLGKEIVSRNILIETGEPLRNEIMAFLQCVREGGQPECTGEDGLAALNTVHRILSLIRQEHP